MVQEICNVATLSAQGIQLGDPLLRAELEARIVADQPQDEIADRMGLLPEVVAEYETAFFNHRGLRWDQGPAWREIVGWPDDGVLDQYDVRKFWLMVASHLGMYFLRKYLNSVSRKTLNKEGLLAYMRKNRRLPIGMKRLAVQTFFPPLRGERQPEIFNCRTGGHEHCKKVDDEVAAVIYDRVEWHDAEEQRRVKLASQLVASEGQ